MWNTQNEELRDKAIWGAGIVIIAGVIGIGVYYRFYAHPPVQPEKTVQVAPPAHKEVEEDVTQHPLPQAKDTDAGLPALNESDPLVRDSLAGLVDPRLVERFLVPEDIVRHIVVTIDNLPRKKVAADKRPVKATPGQTRVSSQGDRTVMAEQNYARYAPFVKAVAAIDPKQLAAVYFRLYPLFQGAYENLGYPGKYFNDRLVQAIDDMLKAPEISGQLELAQPKVFYEFGDPDLEERSAGQKLLMRMGGAQEHQIKERLRALRAEIVRGDKQ
jgi:hypothetical protein